MANAEKISVSLDHDLAEWARKRARATGTTLSAVIAGRLEIERRMENLDRLLASMRRKHGRIDESELAKARRDLFGDVTPGTEKQPARSRNSTR